MFSVSGHLGHVLRRVTLLQGYNKNNYDPIPRLEESYFVHKRNTGCSAISSEQKHQTWKQKIPKTPENLELTSPNTQGVSCIPGWPRMYLRMTLNFLSSYKSSNNIWGEDTLPVVKMPSSCARAPGIQLQWIVSQACVCMVGFSMM